MHRTPFERAEQAIIVSALVLMVVICVQPIMNLVAVSLSEPARVPGMSGFTVVPRGLSLQVYELLATNPAVQRGLWNSAVMTLTGTLLSVACTALMAWGLSRPGLPLRRSIFVLVLVTIVFEPGMIPDYFINKRLGLLNTYWSVILYKLVNAWYLIILVRFFEELPKELLEAAEMDGANAFQVFWKVVLPLAKPALATITLFYLVFRWNEFFRAMLYLSDPNLWPLQLVLRQFVVEGDKLAMVGVQNMNNYTGASQIDIRALKAGMIMVTIAPILVVYPLILKYFTKGTMAGAVKG